MTITIVKGVNGWRIEKDDKILIDKVFNTHLEAFSYYKNNLKLNDKNEVI